MFQIIFTYFFIFKIYVFIYFKFSPGSFQITYQYNKSTWSPKDKSITRSPKKAITCFLIHLNFECDQQYYDLYNDYNHICIVNTLTL